MLGMEKSMCGDNFVESETTTKRVENADGSSETISVEKVEGGYIKSVSKRYKDKEGEWQYSDKRSVSMEDPFEQKSLVEKLAEFLK